MTFNLPIIAMALSAIGNILMGLGSVIQKKGADQSPEIGKYPLKETIIGFFTNKTWLKGEIIAFIGLPIYLVSFLFGEIIYIQPMLGLGTLTIVIYAIKKLKEKTTKTEITGIILIIMGPAIIAYGAQSITAMPSIFDNLSIYIFYIAIYIILLILIFVSRAIPKSKKRAVTLAITTGLLLGIAAFSGRLSALTNLNILFVFLLIVNLLGGTVFSQIMYQHGRAVVTLTISNVFNIVLPIFAGIFILSERITPVLALGVTVILLGCIFVSKIQSKAIEN
jgi:drug/metabolite transporter (DMT)-like permease